MMNIFKFLKCLLANIGAILITIIMYFFNWYMLSIIDKIFLGREVVLSNFINETIIYLFRPSFLTVIVIGVVFLILAQCSYKEKYAVHISGIGLFLLLVPCIFLVFAIYVFVIIPIAILLQVFHNRI